MRKIPATEGRATVTGSHAHTAAVYDGPVVSLGAHLPPVQDFNVDAGPCDESSILKEPARGLYREVECCDAPAFVGDGHFRHNRDRDFGAILDCADEPSVNAE